MSAKAEVKTGAGSQVNAKVSSKSKAKVDSVKNKAKVESVKNDAKVESVKSKKPSVKQSVSKTPTASAKGSSVKSRAVKTKAAKTKSETKGVAAKTKLKSAVSVANKSAGTGAGAGPGPLDAIKSVISSLSPTKRYRQVNLCVQLGGEFSLQICQIHLSKHLKNANDSVSTFIYAAMEHTTGTITEATRTWMRMMTKTLINAAWFNQDFHSCDVV